ncbi:hypothetical protein ETI06_03965 [Macrococcoides goetzii]|nr:hypothetical protein [Macrococcus goetzii]TDM49631.1 hypothetical protein ETI06_03965 [Macrococcus goetzii]
MKKILCCTITLSILLAGCGQNEEKESKKPNNITINKKEDDSKSVKKEKNFKKKENKSIKRDNQKDIANKNQTEELNTIESSIETNEIQSMQSNQVTNGQSDVKTNENGRKILGYTPEGYEIVDYTPEGEPIVDMVQKPGSQAAGYGVGEAPPEQSYTRAPIGGNPDVQKPANNPYVNLPNQEWRVNAGGLSSGEIQTRNAILNGTYEGDDAEQVLEAINYYEQKYAPTPK